MDYSKFWISIHFDVVSNLDRSQEFQILESHPKGVVRRSSFMLS